MAGVVVADNDNKVRRFGAQRPLRHTSLVRKLHLQPPQGPYNIDPRFLGRPLRIVAREVGSEIPPEGFAQRRRSI